MKLEIEIGWILGYLDRLVVDCIHARQCWSILGCQPNSAHFSSVQEWFIFLSSSLPRDQLCTVIVCCWEIWRQRNDKIWNNKRIQSAETIVFKASKYLQDWREAALPSLPVNEESTTVQPKWSKPQEGFHKLNVDAAIDSINGKMGFGCVIRDEHGTFVAARGIQWDGVFSPREAEATAIREALSWIKELNLNKVSVETDSLQVVNSLKSSIGESSFHVILSDIKNVLCDFSHVFLSFVKRSTNGVAHAIARYAVSSSGCSEWLSIPPPFLCNALSTDLMN
ncbi:PREDICTED: uncharacterized protein LOC109186242 [Ipomoea nil]|uniref:uncharacterized protein LOC109186242 n=1 Tax=Ipomoea nil TaxID=35883 RepID=UPI0009012822|nr:PREDICTED: uncharacterized protein LOC109186242 [Ipomoea nil]